MNITVNEKPVIVFSFANSWIREGVLERAHFQPPIYFIASFSFAAELKSLTHNVMTTQMEAMHG
jgi:hypothetical protein